MKSIIEHRPLITHNNSAEHWKNKILRKPDIDPQKILRSINEWKKSDGKYIDVHAWYFTPDSFADIIYLLREVGLIKFNVDRIYPTRRPRNEFWAILKAE